jgi:hypothetical protein|tara:strand:- start:881 stop:1627 length:747 start_codon:yes stop_codon:yes gene_type:complete
MMIKRICFYLSVALIAIMFAFILTAKDVSAADSNTVSSTVVTDKSVPTASAPSIVVNNSDVCKSAAAASVQTQVLGFATGITITDENCERIKLARSLYGMGMKVAAISTLCMDSRVFDAMWMAGTPCPYMGKIGNEALEAWNKNIGLLPEDSDIRAMKEVEIAIKEDEAKEVALQKKKEIKAQEKTNKIEATKLKEQERLRIKEEEKANNLKLKQQQALSENRKERSADGEKKGKSWIIPLTALLWLL